MIFFASLFLLERASPFAGPYGTAFPTKLAPFKTVPYTLPREQMIHEIRRLIELENLTFFQASERTGISLTTVRKVCRTLKIGNYSENEDAIVSRSSQAPFGWDVVQGQLVRNQKEWMWVRKIHLSRHEGMSLNQIAALLTRKNVPTKNGGRWFAKTVSQILKFNREYLNQRET